MKCCDVQPDSAAELASQIGTAFAGQAPTAVVHLGWESGPETNAPDDLGSRCEHRCLGLLLAVQAILLCGVP